VDGPGGGRWAALEGRTTYERLRLSNFVKTDPFSGLYVGSYGPHGPELLQVCRQVEGGREWAVATKLTGDPNVPAGTISWKALIGRANRLPGALHFGEERGGGEGCGGHCTVERAGFCGQTYRRGTLVGDSLVAASTYQRCALTAAARCALRAHAGAGSCGTSNNPCPLPSPPSLPPQPTSTLLRWG
jgi:hypothetical protein